MNEALILIDMQNDFMPGGALPVVEGDKVVPVANRIGRHFDLVVATQDWHPANHGSFASQHPGKKPGDVIDLNGLPQVLWPDHCVQQSKGAEFHRALDRSRVAAIFQKGVDPEIDSYSGFYDNGHRRGTGLTEYLRSAGVTDVTIAGLATDYCVKYSVLDALRLGFKTTVVEDACRGVNLKPDDSAAALAEMRTAGAQVVRSTALSPVGR